MLNGRQRRHLRALAHHLQPIVLVGKEGVTPALVRAVDTALEDHELIKVRLEEGEGRRAQAAEIGKLSGAEVAGVIGRIAVLYRRRARDAKIELPR